MKKLNKYIRHSSFAIWSSWKDVKDISLFNDYRFLSRTTSNFIFLALNPSKQDGNTNKGKPFGNFNSDYSHQKDFKLCYAL